MNKPRIALLLLCIAAFGLACTVSTLATGGSSQQGNGVISGVAVAMNGSPAAGASVRIRPNNYVETLMPENSPGKIFDVVTDSVGRFTVNGVEPDSFTVEINDLECSAVAVKVTANPLGGEIDLGKLLLTPYAKIAGAVDTDGIGKSTLFIQVFGFERLVQVDANGRFILADLPAGTYHLQVQPTNSPLLVQEILNVNAPAGATTPLTIFLGWQFVRRIYLNTAPSGAGVAAGAYDFPVLVRLSNRSFDFSEARSNGEDLRFTKNDGTPLWYEIERWDASAQAAEVWVRVDTVFGNDSLHSITMYWGNANAATVSNAAAVFDTSVGFEGVWHLGEGGGTTASDATANHFDGTPFNMTATSQAAGAIGNAQAFDGTSDFIQMIGTAGGKLNFPANGTYAISAWVNADTLDEYFHTVASKGDYQYNLEIIPSDEWEFAQFNDGAGWDMTTLSAQARTWTYLTGVRAGTREYLYVNGELADSAISFNPSTIQRYTGFDFLIGRNRNPANDTTGFFFKGIIDEVRVTSVAPSAEWIKLCYMNQKADDRLLVFGSR